MEAINWRLHCMTILGVLSAEFWVLSAECWLLQATAVRGYNVFLPQVVCQKRKPQIDGWSLSILHILGPLNGSHKLTASLYDYTRGAECWVLSAEYWVLSAECWVLSAECWVLSAECWVLSTECWVLSAECWVLSAECWVLVITSYCCRRLACILTTSCMPKTEATHFWLVSKYTAHTRSIKWMP
jgi:hypothetical protein